MLVIDLEPDSCHLHLYGKRKEEPAKNKIPEIFKPENFEGSLFFNRACGHTAKLEEKPVNCLFIKKY